MKHFLASVLLLITACSDVESDGDISNNSGSAETLFVEWDGQEFRLDNGDSFQIPERHLITDEYPDTEEIIIQLIKPGLGDSTPSVIAQFKAIGFHDVATVETGVAYRDKQTKPFVDDQPLTSLLNVYLTDVITIWDNNYDYNEMDSFIDQIIVFDPREVTVVINLRHSGDPNQESLRRIVDEIKGLGFKTYIKVNVAP